jgi:hypothetical protein
MHGGGGALMQHMIKTHHKNLRIKDVNSLVLDDAGC